MSTKCKALLQSVAKAVRHPTNRVLSKGASRLANPGLQLFDMQPSMRQHFLLNSVKHESRKQ